MDKDPRSTEVPEFTDKSDRSSPAKRRKVSGKSLFKMKIIDLMSLEYNPATGNFIFKDDDFSLVMCGGKITDIFRDDFIFSFEINDGSGTIACFHKYKHDREATIQKLSELPVSAQFLQSTFFSNQSRRGDDETVFNVTNDNTVARKLESDTSEAFHNILTWFNEEIVEKQKTTCIGDIIHIVGHLMLNEIGCRKINVIDFRIVSKEEDLADLALEIDYLNRCVY